MKKIVCFGEIMIRLNPEGFNRFVQADKFAVTYSGAEASVAVSLANYGENASFVTKLPSNEIGQAAVNAVRRYGVDTSGIVRGGERTGIYFIEKGASQRASKVIYDRKYSAIAEAEKEDFDWEKIFSGVDWFHFTGITPALSDNAAEILLAACETAKQKNVKISCDLNYRKNLWTPEKASKVMSEIMKNVDLCIANEEDADKIFGISAPDTDVDKGVINAEGYKYVAEEITKRFGCKYVAFTLRESISASENDWSGMLVCGGNIYTSKKYHINIVDRVGGGDSFGAGLIYSLLNEFDPQKSIEFAVAASCLKHSIENDFNLVSVAEVSALMGGDASGRVKR